MLLCTAGPCGAYAHAPGAVCVFPACAPVSFPFCRWSRLFQARHLRFDGKHRLEVQKAPDPSDVVWENLETSGVPLHGRQKAKHAGFS